MRAVRLIRGEICHDAFRIILGQLDAMLSASRKGLAELDNTSTRGFFHDTVLAARGGMEQQ